VGRNKIDINSQYIYKKYIKGLDTIEKKDGFDLSLGEITNAVADVNERIMENIIYKNLFFKLPFKLGTIMIFKAKPKLRFKKDGTLSLPIDHKETNKLWEEDPEAKLNKKRIYFRNLHTGGYLMYFKWLKLGSNVNNIKGFEFVPVKGAKRKLSAALKDPFIKIDYFERQTNYK
jgi:hypothetical protein